MTTWLYGLAAADPVGSVGGLIFEDENGPLANESLRLLCYADDEVGDPDNPPIADLLIQTDASGAARRNLPAGCLYLAALHLRHQQPSGKPGHGPAYWVYATSWSPQSPNLQPAAGTITVTINHPLVLFNVVASLTWQPTDGGYAADLYEGLKHASEYLYDLTDGQMAFGPVTILPGGHGWEMADLRFLAANDYRPSAYVGGLVASPIQYTAGVTDTLYRPGQVYLGRYWDGYSASNAWTGSWSQEAAYRTIGHEWGHYALFLYDEYQQSLDLDGDDQPDGKYENYCLCNELPYGLCPADASAMAYHYTASEFWHDEHGNPLSCRATDQMRVHGRNDWQTLAVWSDIQGVSEAWLQLPTPLDYDTIQSYPAADLFGRPVGLAYLPLGAHAGPPYLPAPVYTTTVGLAVDGSFNLDELRSFLVQVYTSKQATPSAAPQMLYQGGLEGFWTPPDGLGEITLLGLQANDEVYVQADRYTTADWDGGRYSGRFDASGDNETLVITEDTWPTSLNVGYALEGPVLTTMVITLTSPVDLPTAPTVQLCVPSAEVGCADDNWQQTLSHTGAITWTATIVAPPNTELPHYGLLHIEAPGVGNLLRWFQAAGGVGPGHIDGDAPLRDGPIIVDPAAALPGEHSRVITMPAADYAALTATLPVTVSGLVASPL
ncbi:MAG: hypothetical protein AB1791_14215, partial [Chloroflexota bacterium]